MDGVHSRVSTRSTDKYRVLTRSAERDELENEFEDLQRDGIHSRVSTDGYRELTRSAKRENEFEDLQRYGIHSSVSTDGYRELTQSAKRENEDLQRDGIRSRRQAAVRPGMAQRDWALSGPLSRNRLRQANSSTNNK